MCSGRVFMVMELSGNRGGKNRVLAVEGIAWLAGRRGRDDYREENTTGRQTGEAWNKQDEATRSNGKSAVLRSRWEKQTFPSLRRAPRSAEGFVLEILDGKSLRGSL